MDANCLQCGHRLAEQWSFCPGCGTAVTHVPHKEGHEHHPARGAFGGLFYGLIAAPLLIIPGVLLCFLGWGIFLGVPMIVMGILAPLAGPVFGMGEHKGRCPACGTAVMSIADGKAHHCPVCSRDFAVEERMEENEAVGVH